MHKYFFPVFGLLATLLSAGWTTAQTPIPLLVDRAGNADTTGVDTLTGTGRSISEDGRFVLAQSKAINLAPGVSDLNLSSDVLIHDRTNQSWQLVSRRMNEPGQTASGVSTAVDMTPDGRWVLFQSNAADVVPGVSDSNGVADVYLFDRMSGESVLVSHRIAAATESGNGASVPRGISQDGRFTLFESNATNLATTDTNAQNDLFLYDRETNSVTLISNAAGTPSITANGYAMSGGFSADGMYVAYLSFATNVVAGVVDSNGTYDAFLWNRATGISTLISHSADNAAQTANGAVSSIFLSADSSFAAYTSAATNVATGVSDGNAASDVYRWNRVTDTSTLVSAAHGSPTASANQASQAVSISDDGSWIGFSSSANDLVSDQNHTGGTHLFARDLAGLATLVVSRAHDQPSLTSSSNCALVDATSDGRYFLFESSGTDLGVGIVYNGTPRTNVYLFDRINETTRLVSHRAGLPLETASDGIGARAGSVTNDGRYISFYSFSGQLVADATDPSRKADVFVKDVQTGELSLVSRKSSSVVTAPSDSASVSGMSDDGRWVLFNSFGVNVENTSGDDSGLDVFLFDRIARSTKLVSRRFGNSGQTTSESSFSVLSGSGRYAAYATSSNEVITGISDNNALLDTYLFDRDTNAVQLVSASAGTTSATGDSATWPVGFSTDGRYLLLNSNASDLVAGTEDNNQNSDVFLFDRQTATMRLVTRSVSGARAANARSDAQAISADGRWVVFRSEATDLVSGATDFDNQMDLFLFDANSGSISLISHTPDFSSASFGDVKFSSMSADASRIAFHSNATDLVTGMIDNSELDDLFLYQRQDQSIKLISHAAGQPLRAGNEQTLASRMSRDGRYLAYSSKASDLVAGISDINFASDAFVYDSQTDQSRMISVSQSNAGSAANGATSVVSISPLGDLVGLTSSATNLDQDLDSNSTGDAFVYSQETGAIRLISRRPDRTIRETQNFGSSAPVRIDVEGRILMVSSGEELSPTINDGNGAQDLFLVDGPTVLLSDDFE